MTGDLAEESRSGPHFSSSQLSTPNITMFNTPTPQPAPAVPAPAVPMPAAPPVPPAPVKGLTEQVARDNAPDEGTLIPNTVEKAPTEATPDSVAPKEVPLHEMMVFIATAKLVTREIVAQAHLFKDTFAKNVAAGKTLIIEPGQYFRSINELRAKGIDERTIAGWLKSGGLVKRRVDRMHEKALGNAPAVLGNSTGSKEGDKSTPIHRNNPNVKWGYNPLGLAGKNLSTLRTLIAQTDPSMEPPENENECIKILSADFSK